MSILTTLNPLTNADRLQMWCGAFRYLGKADPLFAVRHKYKFDLRGRPWSSRQIATCGEQAIKPSRLARPASPNSLANRKGRARSALKFVGEIIGGAAFIFLAFAFVALLGLRMGVL